MDADVIVDFASAKAVDGLLTYCSEKKMPVVVCTTGLSEEQIQHVEETARQTAVLRSANMSLGINLLLKLVKEAAEVLAAAGFDIEILEKHHNKKVDAPSGTALALAPSMRRWTTTTTINTTAPRRGRSVRRMRSESRLFAEAPSSVNTT